MATKLVVDCSTGITEEIELTSEEIAQMEIDRKLAEEYTKAQAEEEARIKALKESAKAKLVAGEPLTEEEAATIVL